MSQYGPPPANQSSLYQRQPFWANKAGFTNLATSVGMTEVNYVMNGITTGDLPASRVCQLRSGRVMFNPLAVYSATASTPVASVPGPISAQLFYTNSDNTPIAVTGVVNLSLTNETHLTFSLPRNLTEVRNANDTTNVFSIVLYNRAGTSYASFPVYYTAIFCLETYGDTTGAF
jgi:hypothetical protein